MTFLSSRLPYCGPLSVLSLKFGISPADDAAFSTDWIAVCVVAVVSKMYASHFLVSTSRTLKQ